jgi:hypothetical protein
MCFGSIPVGIGYSDDQPNAATVLAKRVLGPDLEGLVPSSIQIDAPNLKERLEGAISQVMSYSDFVRKTIAEKARSALSHDAWYAEFMSCVNPKQAVINELDL